MERLVYNYKCSSFLVLLFMPLVIFQIHEELTIMTKKEKRKRFGCGFFFLLILLIVVLSVIVFKVYDDYKQKKAIEEMNEFLHQSYLSYEMIEQMNKLKDLNIDSDNDGLDNVTESKIGTDFMNSDTDRDGIKDGDEVNNYKTNPTKISSMDDGISDMVKVVKGLDVNKKYGKNELKSSKVETICNNMEMQHSTINSEVMYIYQPYEGKVFDGLSHLVEPFTLYDSDGIVSVDLSNKVADINSGIKCIRYNSDKNMLENIKFKIKGNKITFNSINEFPIALIEGNLDVAQINKLNENLNKKKNYYVIVFPFYALFDKVKVFILEESDNDAFSASQEVTQKTLSEKLPDFDIQYGKVSGIALKFLDFLFTKIEEQAYKSIESGNDAKSRKFQKGLFKLIIYRFNLECTQKELIEAFSSTSEEKDETDSDVVEEELFNDPRSKVQTGPGEFDVRTGFIKGVHSFKLSNFGNDVSSGGNCAGFAYVTASYYNKLKIPLKASVEQESSINYNIEDKSFELIKQGLLGNYSFTDPTLKLYTDDDYDTRTDTGNIETAKISEPDRQVVKMLSYYWKTSNDDMNDDVSLGWKIIQGGQYVKYDVIENLRDTFKKDKIALIGFSHLDLINGSHGHAVNAYAMEQNALDPNKISVLIYDNNYPYNIIRFKGKDGKNYTRNAVCRLEINKRPVKALWGGVTVFTVFEYKYISLDGMVSYNYSYSGKDGNDIIWVYTHDSKGNFTRIMDEPIN